MSPRNRADDRFLERADDLLVLVEALGAVRANSEGRLVLVDGEAGVGKTALLRRFCEEQCASARVLWGGCEPLVTPRALGPLWEIAQATGGELEDCVKSEARPHQVVAVLIDELQSRVPTVLVLEDLQWADEATLDVLTLLGRRIGAVGALVLASFRDDELARAERLRLVVGDLAGRASRLNVAPLSLAAVSELAEGYRVDSQDLFRRTGGNPFFVTEVLATGLSEMPATVRDAVLARALSVSPDARRLLEVVALAAGHAELWLLDSIAGALVGRLEECLGSGMLRSEGSGVAFRHELARLAVEQSTPPDRAVALHRAALVALESPPFGGPDFVRLAHHAEAAGDAGGCCVGRRRQRRGRRYRERIARPRITTHGRSGSANRYQCRRWRSCSKPARMSATWPISSRRRSMRKSERWSAAASLVIFGEREIH